MADSATPAFIPSRGFDSEQKRQKPHDFHQWRIHTFGSVVSSLVAWNFRLLRLPQSLGVTFPDSPGASKQAVSLQHQRPTSTVKLHWKTCTHAIKPSARTCDGILAAMQVKTRWTASCC